MRIIKIQQVRLIKIKFLSLVSQLNLKMSNNKKKKEEPKMIPTRIPRLYK